MTLLQRADGHAVTPFTSAAEAIAALERTAVDVVVTDLDIPEVDGSDVARVARRQLPAACVASSPRGRKSVPRGGA